MRDKPSIWTRLYRWWNPLWWHNIDTWDWIGGDDWQHVARVFVDGVEVKHLLRAFACDWAVFQLMHPDEFTEDEWKVLERAGVHKCGHMIGDSNGMVTKRIEAKKEIRFVLAPWSGKGKRDYSNAVTHTYTKTGPKFHDYTKSVSGWNGIEYSEIHLEVSA